MLLKHDQYIPDLKNEDPDDLARTAKVTASSTAAVEEFTRDKVRHREGHPLNMPRAVMIPRGVHARLQGVSLLLYSQRNDAVEVTVHVREASQPGDFSSTHDVATAVAKVAPGRLAWVKFPVDCAVAQPYVWFWLPRTEGVSWRLMQNAPPGACRAYGGDAQREWTAVPGQQYACLTEPLTAIACDYRPENVINGAARIVGTTTNQWASDPAQGLPQWIELALPRPAQVNTVYLTFDTDLNNRYHDEPLVRQCVKDYRLEYHDAGQWHELAQVADNYQRRRVHAFPAVTADKLRLTVEATGGDKSARVFEIRAYHEK
jgi:hypothetical protein